MTSQTIDDTQAKRFFEHTSNITPDCYLYTDSKTPEWYDDDVKFDFDLVVVFSKLTVSGYKRKAHYACCEYGNGPVSFEANIYNTCDCKCCEN